MNNISELDARLAIKALIETNKAALVDDITHQGVDREIKQITTSQFTPYTDFYFISIYSNSTSFTSKVGSRVVAVPSVRQATYEMVIEVLDNAVEQINDQEAFELMDNDFVLITDRIVSLIASTNKIQYNGCTFKLLKGEDGSDRVVNKQNMSVMGTNRVTGQTEYVLFSQITFSLTQEG